MIDGVIKYNFDFSKTKPIEKKLFTDIEKVRKRLIKLELIGEKDGIGYGNISQKIDKKQFVITGTQTGHLKNLETQHYSLIEDYNDEKFYIKSSGAIKPSSEALTHATIYNLDEKIKAVIHIHSLYLWEFMLKNNYLKTKDVEYGSIEMINEVNSIYSQIKALSNPKFVMLGHIEGIIFFGDSIEMAEKELLKVFHLLNKH